jgi:hypothetical protein
MQMTLLGIISVGVCVTYPVLIRFSPFVRKMGENMNTVRQYVKVYVRFCAHLSSSGNVSNKSYRDNPTSYFKNNTRFQKILRGIEIIELKQENPPDVLRGLHFLLMYV